MPVVKELRVRLIAKTSISRLELEKWLVLDTGVSEETTAKILDAPCTDAAKLVAVAAKQCYLSFEVGLNPNVTMTREDMVVYLDNVLAQKHGSVMEHVNFTFAITNCTRVLTAELNRHRAGAAISERSMRYIRYEDVIPYWMPISITPDQADTERISYLKQQTRKIFDRSFRQDEENYRELVELWDTELNEKEFSIKKKLTSCFRRILGLGVCTGGVWTFNARSLRHVLTMRCDKAAEEEINFLAFIILSKMRDEEPALFGDFDSKGIPKYHKV